MGLIQKFYYFDKNIKFIFSTNFLPIYSSGSRYFPIIRLCEGNFIILEMVMVIYEFNQA